MIFKTDRSRRKWISDDRKYVIERRVMLGCLGMLYTCKYLGTQFAKSFELRGSEGAMQLCREHAMEIVK